MLDVVESLVASALHIAKRCFGEKPETPIRAFRILIDGGLITSSECVELEKLVRLRNLLVHRYWIVDDRKIYDNVKSDFSFVKEIIGRLQRILK